MNDTTSWPSNLSLPDLFRESVRRYPHNRAIVFAGRMLDYASLDALSNRFAASLAAKGIQKGDRVGLYCVNSDAFVIAYFGISKAGAVVVPVNLLLNPKEIAFILSDAEAKALCYFEAFAPAVTAMASTVPAVAFKVCIGTNKADPDDLSFQDMIATHATPPAVTIDPAEVLLAILYTSGTTGRPKGAMLTHRNLAANTYSIMRALRFEPGKDVVIVVLPMFHAFAATACMLAPLLHGCTIVPVPKFDPVQAAEIIHKECVTHFMAVPSMYNVMLRLPPEHTEKVARLKYAISGGAAMPVEIMKQFEERFGVAVHEGDGPTECSPCTSVNPIGGLRKPATIGLPLPLVEMCIMNEDGKELPNGEIGEICVRGPNVMKGYWKLSEDTAQAFFGEWFRTGDLGTRDADGYFSIVDRKKDMVIVNGMNVYPRMVEEVLYRHPAIREAAVIGEPHELHGEIPVACVSLKPGQQATAGDLRQFCLDNLGRHEVPRKFNFLDELPKNAAGKIMKRELRKQGELERGVDSREG